MNQQQIEQLISITQKHQLTLETHHRLLTNLSDVVYELVEMYSQINKEIKDENDHHLEVYHGMER